LRVRWHRRRLDRELAAGCECEASQDRAVRAGQLADPVTRRQLARSLRRAVASAERPAEAFVTAAVPVRRPTIVPSCQGLLGLAERLEQDVPLNPRGVARALVLLTDAAGPLYSAGSERSMSEAVWWVADGLQGCPPHAWGCPKVMKLDPDYVAWTCGRCGAIATTGDPAVKPA